MKSNTTYRVVLDTNTIISAGSRWLANEPHRPVSLIQRLVFAVASSHVGLYCQEILDEYVELMVRRKHPQDRIALFVSFIHELFTCVAVVSVTCHTLPTDADDEIFILCALDGSADILVSDDKHLLRIREAYLPCPNILGSVDAREYFLKTGYPDDSGEGQMV